MLSKIWYLEDYEHSVNSQKEKILALRQDHLQMPQPRNYLDC
jgi:hypothetical protein